MWSMFRRWLPSKRQHPTRPLQARKRVTPNRSRFKQTTCHAGSRRCAEYRTGHGVRRARLGPGDGKLRQRLKFGSRFALWVCRRLLRAHRLPTAYRKGRYKDYENGALHNH